MSSAEAQASTNGNLADIVARLRASPRIALIIGVAVAVAVLVALLLWARSPDYAVLYSGLSNRDGGDVVARLDQMQVPYELTGGGSTIRVPRSRVDRVRLQMASDGLPKGGGAGFELMDNEPFGISEFAEKINYQRGLAGELERSIETIDEVSNARVQLAIPKSSVFVRDRKQPKASVVLDLYSGRALAKGQVAAIQHLVASAVSGLPVDAVTLVDGHGHLLSGDDEETDADGSQLAYTTRVEKTYQQRIQHLLAPIVGADNVRTQVVAELDFAQRERTHENYSPNNGDKPAAIRSRQTSHKVDRNKDKGGVPGALSNQPTPDQPSPINNPKKPGDETSSNDDRTGNTNRNADDPPLQTNSAFGLDDSDRISTSNNATTNYELDHTIAHVIQPVGRVLRVSVAVVINQNAAGTTGQAKNTPAGLSGERMDQIRGLVRGAIGYSTDRGDAVAVMQLPFSDKATDHAGTTPAWWQDPTLQAMALGILKYLILALVAWLLWRRLIKPLLERSGLLGETVEPRQKTAAPATDEADAGTAEQALRAQRHQRHDDAIRQAQQAARDDPRAVAMIVKGWMQEDG